MRRSILSNVSITIATLIVLYSSMPYFVWNIAAIKPVLLVSFIFFRSFLIEKTILEKIKLPLFIYCVLWFYLYIFHADETSEIFTTIITRLLPVLFVILFSTKEKKSLLNYITNVFASIIVLSLLFYILWFLGVDLPFFSFEHPDSFYGEFANYFFFVIKNNLGMLTRFQSVFLEPGHLGMFAAFLLYLNLYNWHKWQCWVFLIALLWSFSLAAYVLLVIGFVIYKISIAKNIIWAITRVFVVLFILGTSSIIYYYSHPDSLVSIFILSRLEVDDKQGIKGNNRNDAMFMKFYARFSNTADYLVGIGIKRYSAIFNSGGNSSYRVFIVQYGMIGLLLLLLLGISLVNVAPSNIYWGLLLFYCISFIQRPYALWEIELFPFICFASMCKYRGNRNSIT